MNEQNSTAIKQSDRTDVVCVYPAIDDVSPPIGRAEPDEITAFSLVQNDVVFPVSVNVSEAAAFTEAAGTMESAPDHFASRQEPASETVAPRDKHTPRYIKSRYVLLSE